MFKRIPILLIFPLLLFTSCLTNGVSREIITVYNHSNGFHHPSSPLLSDLYNTAAPPEIPNELSLYKPARLVHLQSTVSYHNLSDTDLPMLAHYFTLLPSELEFQQIIQAEISCSSTNKECLPEIKFHKNGLDRYIKYFFSMKHDSTETISISYYLILFPVDYNDKLTKNYSTSLSEVPENWLASGKYIESDSDIVKKAVKSFSDTANTPLELSKLAYQYPAQVLDFIPQKKALGAEEALLSGTGDCTEYAAVFAALSRACGIPARLWSVFTLGDLLTRSWSQPNHSMAETCFPSTGWIPIDPNLSLGKFENQYSYGKVSNSVIFLKRGEGSWVWSKARSSEIDKTELTAEVLWTGEVIAEGSAEELVDWIINNR